MAESAVERKLQSGQGAKVSLRLGDLVRRCKKENEATHAIESQEPNSDGEANGRMKEGRGTRG